MNLHIKQNEMNRREMERKYRKKAVVEFFGDSGLGDMSDRFEVLYNELKGKIDKVRLERANLEIDLKKEEQSYDEMIDAKTKELNSVISKLQVSIDENYAELARVEAKIRVKQAEAVKYDTEHTAKVKNLEKREGENDARSDRLIVDSVRNKADKAHNEEERKKINISLSEIMTNNKNICIRKSDFETYKSDKVAELAQRENKVALDEKASVAKLASLNKQLEDVKANMEDVKAVLARESSVAEREANCDIMEAENKKAREDINASIIKNKLDNNKNMKTNDEMDARGKVLDEREKNINLLTSELATK